MQNQISPLKINDLIYITAPAKSIDKEKVMYAKQVFEEKGYRVLLSKHCLGNHHYFSGTDEERLEDMQFGLDHPDVKAIICARGGYGAMRIVDRIQWASQLRHPKWIVGFSDITVFHQKMQGFGIESIHATMPLNFEKNSLESFSTLFSALNKTPYSIESPSSSHNQSGNANGILVGGNLSILYSLLGTDNQIDFSNTILFIEDVGEQLYSIDRMLFAFKKAGVFSKIKGLIVGGMTDLKDTETPIGFTLEELVLSQFEFHRIPIAFDFPAGHVDDNRALVLGKKVELTVSSESTELFFT